MKYFIEFFFSNFPFVYPSVLHLFSFLHFAFYSFLFFLVLTPFFFSFSLFLIFSDNLIVKVKDKNEKIFTADLLIAADGTFSTVFSTLFPNSQNKPKFRNYQVYRGYSEKSNIQNNKTENSMNKDEI